MEKAHPIGAGPRKGNVASRKSLIGLLACLGVVIALLAYLSIRELRTPAAQDRAAPTSEEASIPEPADDDAQTTGREGLTAPDQPPSARPPKARGARGGDRAPGAGISAPRLDLFVAFNQACEGVECDASASQTNIRRVRTDGSDGQSLVQGIAPRWSPNGRHVASGTHYWSGSLQVMNADGSGVRNLGVQGSFPSWSPDGQSMVFNWPCQDGPTWATYPVACWQYTEGPRAYGCGPSDCGIGVVRADGKSARRLGDGLWPDWGPDGRIVFTDGTSMEPCQYGTAYWYERNMYSTQEESPYRLPSCALQLWVMNADGSGRTQLPIARATAPKWSPDGRRIAYHVESEGAFISDADGTGVQKVAPVGYTDPAWSSDGKWLVFTRKTPDAFIWNIVIRAVDGSTERQLTFGARDTLPSFSPR